MSDSGPLRPRPVPKPAGRLTRDEAVALLIRAGELLAQGDYPAAGDHYLRVVGFDDATITAAALMGLGEVRYRLTDRRSVEACELMRTVIADRLRRLAEMTRDDGPPVAGAADLSAAIGSASR